MEKYNMVIRCMLPLSLLSLYCRLTQICRTIVSWYWWRVRDR